MTRRLGDAVTRREKTRARTQKKLHGERSFIQGTEGLQNAMDSAMLIFQRTKMFPPEERYSLTDQIRRSSRSVASNIAEAWRKRRYPGSFVSKLNDAEGEAAETQTWLEFACRCGYLRTEERDEFDQHYEHILAQLVIMIDKPDDWVVGVNRVPRVAASPRPRV